MAVSPLPSHSPASAATARGIPGAAKTLAMRGNMAPELRSAFTTDGPGGAKPSAPEPELAEQLNVETRNKYVKGMNIAAGVVE